MVAVLTPPAKKTPDRRIAAWVACSLILLVGIPWLAFGSLYSPIRSGNMSAPGENVAWLTDGLHNTNVIVTGKAGTIGVMGFALENAGPVPIRIDGPVVEDLRYGTRPLRGATWSPFIDANGQPVAPGRDRLKFPKTLQSGEQITIWLEIRKYDCNGGTQWLDRVPLRWSVLGLPRQTDWMLEDPRDDLTAPLVYCYPDSALKYVAR